MERPRLVPCPVCNKRFPSSTINEHANICLTADSDTDAQSDIVCIPDSRAAVTNTSLTRKRKPDSDIDQLQRVIRVIWCTCIYTYTHIIHTPIDWVQNKLDTCYKFESDNSGPSGWDFLKLSSKTAGKTSSKGKGVNAAKRHKLSNVGEKLNNITKASDVIDIDSDAIVTEDSIQTNQKTFVKAETTCAQSVKGKTDLAPNPSCSRTPVTISRPSSNKEPEWSDILQKLSEKCCGVPLAEKMRPATLEDYMGQEQAVGAKCMLRSLLQSDRVPSMLLWGPPGCGKTTLARIVAQQCKQRRSAKFVQLSAATSGVNDVKEVIKVAKNDFKMFKRNTILFLDEIHRFNKTQQDSLLPHVEDGTITLIGATTENPSFQVNTALLSRCRVIVLEKLSATAVEAILSRAVEMLGISVLGTDSVTDQDCQKIWIEKQALVLLSQLCDGDARVALNGLQMAVQSQIPKISLSSPGLQTSSVKCSKNSKSDDSPENGDLFDLDSSESSETEDVDGASRNVRGGIVIRTEHVKEGLQRSHLLYDRAGEEHYTIISALHKSMRGSDDSAALYWLARMLEGGETPLYVARRLVRFASEDIGLADPQAMVQAVAAYQGCHLIGMPECEVLLAQCVVYLSRAPKSVEVYAAYNRAKAAVRNQPGPLPSVPLHLRNAPTKLMKGLGYGHGYKYNPSHSGPVDQEYFPPDLVGTNFFT